MHPITRIGDPPEDPFRWLENTDSAETVAWVAEQNSWTAQHIDAIPQRGEIRDRLEELWSYEKITVPYRRGEYWFQSRQSGLEDQPLFYVMSSPSDEGRVLLDPNDWSETGTIALSGVAVSHDGSRIAYATSDAGSDWMTWRVREVASGEDLPDIVEWSKFYLAAWCPNGSGFYYVGLDAPIQGAERLATSSRPRVLLHRLGGAQDEIVFDAEDPELIPKCDVTFDGRYLVVSLRRGAFPQSDLRVMNIETGSWSPLVEGLTCATLLVGNIDDAFYVLTNEGAPRSKIVRMSLDGSVSTIVPEQADCLVSAKIAGGRLVCTYLAHAQSVLRLFTLDGQSLGKVPLPPGASVTSVVSRPDEDQIYFGVVAFTQPEEVWTHDPSRKDATPLAGAGPTFGRVDFVTSQVFVASLDGTQVPVFLVHRSDVVPNGDVPVYLYGYGGFGVPLTPSYSPRVQAWVERGGLFAQANLRGGGEYGQRWHDEGRLAKKQNAFDDFAAVARWLESSGWSRPSRIAITGASNGGLLVGAVVNQAPETIGCAVPEVGVFDALRFHLFTIGWAWTSDYGDPEDPRDRAHIQKWSPLHNISSSTSYPPVLVITGDHDDRVVPGHSYKYTAAMQSAGAPCLLRVEVNTGHGAGKPTSKQVSESADMLAFMEQATAREKAGRREPR